MRQASMTMSWVAETKPTKIGQARHGGQAARRVDA
jgi:hypothetical protein